MNMMNSTERIAYSRELIQKRIEYPTIETWVGYEDAMRKYWNGEYSYDQMSEVVGYYEALNTVGSIFLPRMLSRINIH